MKTILLLDPFEDHAAFLARLLEEEGHSVIVADHPAEAAAMLPAKGVDLVITEAFDQQDDYRFDPGYLQRFQSLVGSTPIMLLSVCPSVASVRPGQFGLAEVLPKPYSLDDLERKVKKLLGEDSV